MKNDLWKISPALVLLLLVLVLLPASTQSQSRKAWIRYSPDSDQFEIEAPVAPEITTETYNYGALTLSGRGYRSEGDGVIFKLWSFGNPEYTAPLDNPDDWQRYLEACATIVRELLLRPLAENNGKSAPDEIQMKLSNELEGGPIPGREYSLKLGQREGVVRFFVGSSRLYVLAVVNSKRKSETTQRFLGSFTAKVPPYDDPRLPKQSSGGTVVADPMLFPPEKPAARVESPATVDYGRVFQSKEVTQRPRIFYKPQPAYTEAARQNKIEGTVVLRVILSADGQVKSIKPISSLPYGLTEAAVDAARQVKFKPAMKDGHEVSMYIQLEYNFIMN
jgi:TonB family protein